MKSRLSCIALLLAGGLAVQCKADYLFTYQDGSGNLIGFTEPSLATSGAVTNFLFDKNAVADFVFQGTAPAACLALGSPTLGCTGLVNSTSIASSLFPNDSFAAPGVFSGTNGATVDILPYSGYLFTYQDGTGNILAFAEPTLQLSGGASQFLFATTGISSFVFNGNTSSCGALGAVNGIGCTDINNSLSMTAVFPLGSFTSPGTYASGNAVVNIVQASAAPEPGTIALVPLAFLALVWMRKRRHGQAWRKMGSAR